MTLEELAELPKVTTTVCDPCRSVHTTINRSNGRHLVLVQDEETKKVEYMFLHPDGRLGAVEDC